MPMRWFRSQALMQVFWLGLALSCAGARADDLVYDDGSWSVTATADAQRPGKNRCMLMSAGAGVSDRFWMGNHGVPRIEPNGSARFGVVLRDSLEILYGKPYPESFESAHIITSGNGHWEVSGTWKSGGSGGTAQLHTGVRVEDFLKIFEEGGEITFVLPLPVAENRFSLKEVGGAIAKYRECLAGQAPS